MLVDNKMEDNDNGISIRVSKELIEILEKLRKIIKKDTWDVMDKNLTWHELTRILARKIKAKSIINLM